MRIPKNCNDHSYLFISEFGHGIPTVNQQRWHSWHSCHAISGNPLSARFLDCVEHLTVSWTAKKKLKCLKHSCFKQIFQKFISLLNSSHDIASLEREGSHRFKKYHAEGWPWVVSLVYSRHRSVPLRIFILGDAVGLTAWQEAVEELSTQEHLSGAGTWEFTWKDRDTDSQVWVYRCNYVLGLLAALGSLFLPLNNHDMEKKKVPLHFGYPGGPWDLERLVPQGNVACTNVHYLCLLPNDGQYWARLLIGFTAETCCFYFVVVVGVVVIKLSFFLMYALTRWSGIPVQPILSYM